jgi:hypothetical protein
MKLKILKIFLLLFMVTSCVLAKPRARIISGNPYNLDAIPSGTDAFTKAQISLDANTISTWIWNTGVFNQDMRTTNTPGLMWPKGSSKFAIFTSGLTIGTYMNGNLRLATASYAGEYQPGYVDLTPAGPVFKTSTDFKLYKVVAGDNASNNPDFANWGLMIPFGAPYVDIDGNKQYTPGVDKPGIKDAAQTIFVCLTDADPNTHSASEGFSGGTLPIYAEMHLTAWAYSSPGLEDMNFINWVVINKSGVAWDSTHFGVVVDPDLGLADDDYIGCDTLKNLGFCYNGDDVDGTGATGHYGASPPASGMDYFKSPLIPTGNPADVDTTYFPPGSENAIIKTGVRQIGLTSFIYYNNGGPEACATDPTGSPLEAYNFLKGNKNDGTRFINPQNNSLTRYVYPGDPESGAGWTEYAGRIENCNGATTGTPVIPSPIGDRRFIFNSGSSTFKMNSLDTQVVVLAQFVARGTSNKNSVTKLKNLDQIVQTVYDKNFKVIPPPPPPVVNVSYKPNSTIGTVDITFSWGDVSEQYNFKDDLFNQGTYKFQGYEIYEIKNSAQQLPNFNDPSTINNDVTLLDIFDLRDSIGIVIDTFKTGVSVNGNEQYAPFPIVPPYKMPTPANFPNKGIQRSYTAIRTSYAGENGGRDRFIVGNTYKFAVVAYGVVVPTSPTSVLKGGKVVRNSLSTQLLTVRPEAPTAGTNYYSSNGDTLSTNKRDLGVMPIVVDQTLLKNAKYKIFFRGTDTTYNILRSLDGGANYDTLRKVNEENSQFLPFNPANPVLNLKYTRNRTGGTDSSRVVDGILMNVVRIRTTDASGNPNNAGVIKDNTATIGPDSSQTRSRGWEYTPSQNNWLTGSKFLISPDKKWQSESMSISYPNSVTYSGLGSSFKPDSLRKVRIEFTADENSGQLAYRFVANGQSAGYIADPSYAPFIQNTASGYIYQDRRRVPFKVFAIDMNTGVERQVNCAFLELNDTMPRGKVDGKWMPSSDSTGSGERLYIFNSTYSDADVAPYATYTTGVNNLLFRQATTDILYVWAPRAINSNARWTAGDQFTIYPYTVTRPGVVYEFDTRMPEFGNVTVAADRNAMNDIRVVPNPYYGYNRNETSVNTRFVTFRKLPVNCTIRIYTLNGDLVKKITKNDQNPTVNWELKNLDDVPVASGLYIVLIDAPGIGQKTMKLAIFTPEERVDF